MIDTILASKEAFLKEIDTLLSAKAATPEALARPIALREAQLDDIAVRIAALETLRKDQNARIDAQIAALKADHSQARDALAVAERTLKPALAGLKTTKPPRAATKVKK